MNLLGGEPLGIFSEENVPSTPPEDIANLNLPTWDRLQAKTFSSSLSKPPSNHFQELMQWTRQGKVWTFPIDNEVGESTDGPTTGFKTNFFTRFTLLPH